MSQRAFRSNALSLCCAFLTVVITPHFLCAENPKAIPGEAVDRAVIAALSHQGVTKPKVISHIDLTGPFGTATQWTLVVVQDDGKPETADPDEHGPIFPCLVKAASPDCALDLYQRSASGIEMPYLLFAGSVVYAHQDKSDPKLFLRVCGEPGGNGNCAVATAIYFYDKGADRFIRAFLNHTGRNNNEATRFVESGPLQGDMIVDYPTDNAPYTYWIEVYRAGSSGQYGQILRYRGVTGYSDGNPLAVLDSEMPGILHHFGYWKPDDPLPVPAHLPQGCSQVFMRHGEEWCK